jgi:hypothetical protein
MSESIERLCSAAEEAVHAKRAAYEREPVLFSPAWNELISAEADLCAIRLLIIRGREQSLGAVRRGKHD